jgi:hypothetical protein
MDRIPSPLFAALGVTSLIDDGKLARPCDADRCLVRARCRANPLAALGAARQPCRLRLGCSHPSAERHGSSDGEPRRSWLKGTVTRALACQALGPQSSPAWSPSATDCKRTRRTGRTGRHRAARTSPPFPHVAAQDGTNEPSISARGGTGRHERALYFRTWRHGRARGDTSRHERNEVQGLEGA